MYPVVLVDDEAPIVDGLEHAINWEGYSCEICLATTDALMALEYIKTHPVALLITDMSMPDLDGLSLLQGAKQVNPLLAVLILSAYDDFNYVRNALRYGAENYLLKPLDSDELAESISQIVRHIETRQQMSSDYSINMLTFRSTFVENWVNNQLSLNDLQTRASFLGINLSAPSFVPAIFIAKDQRTETMSYFMDLLLSRLPGFFAGHFYFESPIRLIGVFAKLPSNPISLQDFLEDIYKDASKPTKSIFTLIGQEVFQAYLIHESYKKAKSELYLQFSAYSIKKSTPTLPKLSDVIHESMPVWDPYHLCPSILSSYFRPSLSNQELKIRLEYMVTNLILNSNLSLERLVEHSDCFLDLLKHFPIEPLSSTICRQYSEAFVEVFSKLLTQEGQYSYPVVDAAIHAIESFSDHSISLKTLSQKLNVSPSYLGLLFQKQTGSYFNDYLTDARLKKATYLLLHTDCIIKDIVDDVGFSSPTYFNRIFKRHYHLSPSAYRRKHRDL